ncbi:hypothetical protein [Tenacibaculum maritimum]|uniref:hypothetical protein n=4 Tax=Tenacibaculum maritimum TaxID=107401 RepID=UPI003877F433
MMILKTPTLALRHYLVLANLILTLFASCKKQVKIDNSTLEKVENTIRLEDILGDEYNDKKLIKQIDFENNGKKLNSYFFLKEQGEIGTSGFLKELDVLIYENKNLIDKYSFENQSPLCDLKVPTKEIKILSQEKNQILYFPIVHSCDGEEPELLKINIWNNKKISFDIDIPTYFQNTESKIEFAESIAAINFVSNEIKENAHRLIYEKTKIDLSKIKFEKTSKVDAENPKLFTSTDINNIKFFLNNPSKENFSKYFKNKENISLDFIISYIKSRDRLNQNIMINKINDNTDKLKCEIYCYYNLSQEETDDGELSEETLYVYFNKINGRIYLNKLESEGR